MRMNRKINQNRIFISLEIETGKVIFSEILLDYLL